jgi:hypothetical protein
VDQQLQSRKVKSNFELAVTIYDSRKMTVETLEWDFWVEVWFNKGRPLGLNVILNCKKCGAEVLLFFEE